jgi:Protein of unknown function (DUF3570)
VEVAVVAVTNLKSSSTPGLSWQTKRAKKASTQTACTGNIDCDRQQRLPNNPLKLLAFSIKALLTSRYQTLSKARPINAALPEAERINTNPSLNALTAAALVLPGLMLSTPVLAEDDEVGFQYSHYQEGKRNLYGSSPDKRNPIEVDSIHGGAKITLSDRIKFAFNYTEDTWGGATPVATAPLGLKLNQSYTNKIDDVVVGASPLTSRNIGDLGIIGDSTLSRSFQPVDLVAIDDNTGQQTWVPNNQLVHTLSIASPETRKQGDFKLTYEWDEAAVDVGGGISIEPDYESRFSNLGARFDFNQKLTTLNLGLSYTNSETHAIIDHDAAPYIKTIRYGDLGQTKNEGGTLRLLANRQDWAANVGLTQVLSPSALIQGNVSYSRGSGYMANPYKVVTAIFLDTQAPDCGDIFCDGRPGDVLTGALRSFLEVRPEIRNQWTLSGRYVQHINPLDAALHLDYRFATDDWGINAHTFEADWVQPLGNGWTVTPRVRYYSQDAADFYQPFFVVNQRNSGNDRTDASRLPKAYSSDQRLSGYGALSGGISISKQFTKGVMLETGIEYYTHSGSLKLGGGGEGDYSNFDYYFANAALKVNLAALGQGGGGAGDHHHHHHHHHGAPLPAGVMFGHMMENAGDFMVGYRYMYNKQAGDMLHGSDPVVDRTIVTQGCGGVAAADNCYVTPNNMNMHMHMLDIMYAPTSWLNLMLMPQFVDMDMTMRRLRGAPADQLAGGPDAGDKSAHILHHLGSGHKTGGIGDTGMYALFKLVGTPNHHINMTLGVTAPTGDVGISLRRNHQVEGGYIHYGMQLGSGTWDFKPALTYTGQYDKWGWGIQANATKRMQNRNSSGFKFGDIVQSSAWGSYNIFDWLSASVRGIYTLQGAVKHEYNDLIQTLGPMDFQRNYGGKFWDVGFGLNAAVMSGDLAGNSISFEWLQPVSTDVNGYQLDRDGAVNATWNYAF